MILGEPHPYDPDTYYVVDYDTEGHKIVWTKDVLSSLIIRGYAKEVFDQVKELSRVKVRLIEV